ncbi:MAG: DUF115 domain-containing protein [Desulfobacula sp.]|nr:DUF115 domain-containing protein [Desulfobacula sp.]
MAKSDNILLKKNLSLLRKNFPDAFEQVSRVQEKQTDTELVFSENQKLNLKVKVDGNKEIFIHNQDDPGAEVEQFFPIVKENSTGIVLMFGMGLGYSVLELLRKREKIQYLVVFELNMDFFIHALENMDLTDVFTDKRVKLCLGNPDNLALIMAPVNKALMLENIHTLNLVTCFSVNKDYEDLSARVFDYINAFNTDGATKTRHGKTFFENRLKHLTSIHHDRKLEELAGRFKGIPAIIVAAGPSLDKNIDQIAKAMGKAVIISVDTALPGLLKHGVKPDFITAIDYNPLTYEKIAGQASDPICHQINLICTSWVTDTVTKQFPADNIFWAFGSNALENWINRSFGGRMAIGGVGTVAHLNFTSAQIMGCDPIIFVGQDLAFPNRKGHSSNVVLSSDEIVKKMFDSQRDMMWVKGNVDPKVPTSRQMHGYKHGFEIMIKGSNVKVINSTEGGAFIEGAEPMPLVRAIDEFCIDPVTVEIDHAQKQDSPVQSIESSIKEILKLEHIIQKEDKLIGQLKEKLGRLKKSHQRFVSFEGLPEKLKKKISDLDIISKKADASLIWPIFDEMTMDGLRQNEREIKELEKIQRIPDKYLEWLLRSIERMGKINKIRTKNLGGFKNQLSELVTYYCDEKRHREKFEKDKTDLKSIAELAKLYSDSGNYVLLGKMLEKCDPGIQKSALVQYYYGIVSLSRGDYEDADIRFKSALDDDASFAQKIDKNRNDIADYYCALAKSESTLVDFGIAVVYALLIKGLKRCPGHAAIKNQLKQFAQNDLKKIEKEPESSKGLLEKWMNLIATEKEVSGCLTENILKSFYLDYGKILVDEQKYQDALTHYQDALSILPVSADIYIALADINFIVGDLNSGVRYLKTAVDIDKEYAVYWYNMGKNLQMKKDYDGAILAFEQYFIALPDKTLALKEIGDCYTELGNHEAAKEAYKQYDKLK